MLLNLSKNSSKKAATKRIVVVGGGFGGINLVKGLSKSNYEVVLIDKNNYHAFQPLLYQVATAGLEPDSIAYPLRKLFAKQTNFNFRIAEVQFINLSEKIIETNNGKIGFDYLVMANGATTNFFGNKQIEKTAMPMKKIIEAIDIRSKMLQSFEAAIDSITRKRRKQILTFVIAGGGPTGVELAGSFAEFKKHVATVDYSNAIAKETEIHLIEGGNRLLATMNEKSSKKALDFLQKLGVKVHLNALITNYDGKTAEMSNGQYIEAETLVWAAGVRPKVIDGITTEKQIEVNQYLEVKDLKNVFALGDVSYLTTKEYPKGYPRVAQVAIQQGKLLAKNFKRMQKRKKILPFKYKDQGSLATIGRNKAVADLYGMHFSGMFAWFIWMFVHLFALIGFRNRTVTFVNWVWNYFRYDQGTRLIITPYKSPYKKSTETNKTKND